ncbi:MAG: putative aspartyl protease [Verrucomicrobiales bacterium]|jgi:predicted aspartyl protease
MSMNLRSFALVAAAAGFAFSHLSSSHAQLIPRKSDQLEYREFTSSDGKKIKAVLVDKTDNTLTLRLADGRKATLPYDKLSAADQEYVREWDKEKDLFLTQCKSLRIGSMLELRGYESFKFQLKGNHIFVKGELNGNPADFMIDTGAGSTVLDVIAAKKKGCDVGPMDQKIYGVGGEAPAALTKVPEIKLGESIIKDQTLLAADLFKDIPGARRDHDAILGAEFMSQLRAVISYKEGRIFLRPDLVDNDEEEKVAEPPKYRIFKLANGKSRAARIKKKNPSSTELNVVDREGKVTGQVTILNNEFSDDDKEYIEKWTPERDLFLRQCRGLTVQDILELRQYESFEYKRQGNHIFVDGKLNGKDRLFMIDTGAGSTVLHVEDALETGCAVGPMTEKVYGIGGEAPAARVDVASVELGGALFENRQLMALDMFKQMGRRGPYCGLFGADFLRETDAVITYREQKIFLQADKSDKKADGGEDVEEEEK